MNTWNGLDAKRLVHPSGRPTPRPTFRLVQSDTEPGPTALRELAGDLLAGKY
jgi:hypothetical protein